MLLYNYMLTLTKKRGMNLLPICKIQGGKNDGKILYLNIDPINIVRENSMLIKI